MARTGCAFVAVTCPCTPARTHRDRQVLPAYGLQDLPIKNQNPRVGSNPNTMCLPVTLGENLGGGHFYLAQTRTFLLCVDRNFPSQSNPLHRPHVHCELPSPAACTDVREAEEIERGWLLPLPLRMFLRVSPKVHQPGLFRVERQTVFCKPFR